MLGDDPLYDAARLALLDALEALGPHRQAVTLVGAQAIYLRIGEGDIAVAPTTTDADLAIDPRGLAMDPAINEAMKTAGFTIRERKDGPEPGIWEKTLGRGIVVSVDLLVGEGVAAGSSRRTAHLEGHDPLTARRVTGIEGALVDADLMRIEGLDGRAYEIRVAGPAAMLVAKIHKISDRHAQRPQRLNDKDALDVLRLMRGTSTGDLTARVHRMLEDGRSRQATEHAIGQARQLFGRAGAVGVEMAVRATEGLVGEEEVRQSMVTLIRDWLDALSAE